MNELSVEKLQEYLQHAIAIETDIATQTRIVEQYKANALARKPILRCNDIPEKPKAPDYEEEIEIFWSFGFMLVILMAFVCACIGFGLSSGGFSFFSLLFFGGAVWLIIFPIKSWLSAKKVNKERAEYYYTSLSAYNKKASEIMERNSLLEQKHSEEVAKWSNSNEEVYLVMNQTLDESKSTLDKLYSLDYIYPKYRTLPALTSIYEYLITGRCEGLTGSHGAYNLYEDEVRKDMVISQLSVVIENLEQIKQNQYMLYQQVKEIQQTTSNIESELRQIKGYTVQIASLTALNTYYAALTERNTRITMWCNI